MQFLFLLRFFWGGEEVEVAEEEGEEEEEVEVVDSLFILAI